jgi:hypothetical protein
VYEYKVAIKGLQEALDGYDTGNGYDAEAESEGENDEHPAAEGNDSNAVPLPIIKQEHVNPDEHQDPPWYMDPTYRATDQIFGRLLDVFMFSIDYDIPGFKLAINLKWQRFQSARKRHLSIPAVRNIYERLPPNSGLALLLVHILAFKYKPYQIELDCWAKLPGSLLAEVILLALRRVSTKNTIPNPNRRWCDFHEHQTEEEKVACRNKAGRQEDPDMVYEVRKASKTQARSCPAGSSTSRS